MIQSFRSTSRGRIRGSWWGGALSGLAGMSLILVCLVALPSMAPAHPLGPGFDGRMAGQPDLEKVGQTTYQFRPGKKEYEIRRPNQPTSFAHVDPAQASTVAGLGAYVQLPTWELAPHCRSSGNRIVVVYTHRPWDGTPTPTGTLRSIVQRMNWKIADQSAQSSGGSRSVKMAVDCSGGAINVYNVATSDNSIATVSSAVRSQLFGEPTGANAVKYMSFDHESNPSAGGYGEIYGSDGKSSGNLNGSRTAASVIYEPLWSSHASIHELFHTLGATQGLVSNPPFATSGSHCTDGIDMLCYNDGTTGAGAYSETRCPAGAGYETPDQVPIDCGKDTYFNASPPVGSWLATHWDLAGPEDPFLVARPKVTTSPATSLTGTSARLNAFISPEGASTSFYFEYGLTGNYGSKTSSTGVGSEVPQSNGTGVVGLERLKTYYYRAVASSDVGTSYGQDLTFTTPDLRPGITMETPTFLKGAQATLKASVNPNGYATGYRFEWGTQAEFEKGEYSHLVPVPNASIGSGKSAVSVSQIMQPIKGLTTYHYRLTAENSEGKVTSADKTLTAPDWRPTIVSYANDVKSSSAKLGASINPNGFSTTYQIEYGLTTSYGSKVPAVGEAIGSGDAGVQVGQIASGLLPNTVYHFRVVATNSEGTRQGVDTELRTTRPGVPSFAYWFGGKGSADGLLSEPRGVALDSAGNIHVADYDNHRVDKFSPPGGFLSKIRHVDDGYPEIWPYDVAIDSSGFIYIGSSYTPRVEKFSPTGQYLSEIDTWSEVGASPEAIAVDAAGNLYVAGKWATTGGGVIKFSPSGTKLATFGNVPGAGQVFNPRGIAVGPEGNVYVADSGGDRIAKFDSTGKYLSQIGFSGTVGGSFDDPRGVDIGPEGLLYVADAGNHRVEVFKLNGEFVAQFGAAGPGSGEIVEPHGVAVGSGGAIYVSDAKENWVQRWVQPTSEAPYAIDLPAGVGPSGFATLKAQIYPAGSPTTYQFEYGTTTAYGSKAPASPKSIGSGTDAVEVNQSAGGLTSNTTYHYRVVATNSVGSAFGQDMTFTTGSVPTSSTPPTISPSTPAVAVWLTGAKGKWLGLPTSYSYQWTRCDTSGAECVKISGATEEEYLPVAADAGHKLILNVTASNSEGFATASSQPTAVVKAIGEITEFSIPGGGGPSAIARGSDGNLWYSNWETIGKITKTGTITEYPVEGGSSPLGITQGPESRRWFAGTYKFVGKITSAGVVTTYPTSSGNVIDVVTGPDGNIWYTATNNVVGKMSTSGVYTEYTIPKSGSPKKIAVGDDGNMWFTISGCGTSSNCRIGKITTAGVITEYTLPLKVFPDDITAGPDGNLWFTGTMNSESRIGRITLAGKITEFAIPGATNSPAGIAEGPDENLWFTLSSNAKIGRITTGGTVTTYAVPAGSEPTGIAAGPDGMMWFTNSGSGKIGTIAP